MNVKGPNLTIANGESASDALTFRGARGMIQDADFVVIYAPATLTGTVTVEVSNDGTNYVTLTSGGNDVEVPAGKAVVVDFVGWAKLRLKSSGTEGAARTFGTAYGTRKVA